MTLKWPPKDPDEILDYTLDWADRLAGDTIATVTWLGPTPSGLTKTTQSNTTTAASVWFSGGTELETYTWICRITTAGGRTMDQSVAIKIKSR